MARPTKNEDHPGILDQICKYIADHPKCSRDDVADYFMLAPRTVNGHLLKLRRTGKIRRDVRYGVEGGSLWEIGTQAGMTPDGPLDQIGEPRRVTVTTWEPHHFRDPLVAWIHPLKASEVA